MTVERYAGAGSAPGQPSADRDERVSDPHPGSVSDGTQPAASEVQPLKGKLAEQAKEHVRNVKGPSAG